MRGLACWMRGCGHSVSWAHGRKGAWAPKHPPCVCTRTGWDTPPCVAGPWVTSPPWLTPALTSVFLQGLRPRSSGNVLFHHAALTLVPPTAHPCHSLSPFHLECCSLPSALCEGHLPFGAWFRVSPPRGHLPDPPTKSGP